MGLYKLEDLHPFIPKLPPYGTTDADRTFLRHYFEEQLYRMLTELQIPDSSFFDLHKIFSSRLDLMDWFTQKSREITEEIFLDYTRYTTVAFDDAIIVQHQSNTREYLQEKLFPDLEKQLRIIYPKRGFNIELEEFAFEPLFDYGTKWHVLHYDDNRPTLLVEYILKPKLVGDRVKVHILLIFISIFGGLATFGLIGIIFGPLITIAFLSMVDIYHKNYGKHLL